MAPSSSFARDCSVVDGPIAMGASGEPAYADADFRSRAMMKIQRILLALMLLIAYPAIADIAALAQEGGKS